MWMPWITERSSALPCPNYNYMFHLLPEKEKKALEAEYHYRLSLVLLIFILGTLVAGSVFLLPSYLLSERKLSDISFRNDQVKKEIQAKTDPEVSDFLTSLKSNLAALKPGETNPKFSILMKEITDKKPSGISINDIQWDNKTLVAGGIAGDRETLLGFSRDLQSVSDFSKVDLPISDFAKNKDIDFTLTITLKTNG